MFKIFNSHAEQKIADVHTAAMKDVGWKRKKTLVKKCVSAFEAGHPEKLQAFLQGYLEFKLADGWIERAKNDNIDEGFSHLLCAPVSLLLEAQNNPAAALEDMTSRMVPYYKQLLLDLVLRYACAVNHNVAAATLVAAGADVNAGNGRALGAAASKNHLKIVELLLDAKADIGKARTVAPPNYRDAFDAAIKACEAPPVAPPSVVAPAIQGDDSMRGEEDLTPEEAAAEKEQYSILKASLHAIRINDGHAFDSLISTFADLDIYQGKLLSTCVELNNYSMAKKLMLRGADVLIVEQTIQAALSAVSQPHYIHGRVFYTATSQKTQSRFQELTTQKERLQTWKKEVMDYAVHIARLENITDLRAEVDALRTIVNDLTQTRQPTVLTKKQLSAQQH